MSAMSTVKGWFQKKTAAKPAAKTETGSPMYGFDGQKLPRQAKENKGINSDGSVGTAAEILRKRRQAQDAQLKQIMGN